MRRLLLFGVLGAMAACGSIVGVTELTVTGSGTEPERDGSVDAEPIREASTFDPDDGIKVEPPVDAGCDAAPFGPFVPNGFRFEADDGAKMHWVSGAENVKGEEGNAFTLQSAAFADGKTVSIAVKFQEFNALIPDNRRIVGIGVDLKGRQSRADFIKDNDVRIKLNADGSITSANHANPTPWPTGDFVTRTYGGSGTLWELEKSLRPATVNAVDFGVKLVLERPFNDITSTFDLDLVQVTIWTCDIFE